MRLSSKIPECGINDCDASLIIVTMAELQSLENAFALFRVDPDETSGHLLNLYSCMWCCTEVRSVAPREAIIGINGKQELCQGQLTARLVDTNAGAKVIERVFIRLNGDAVNFAHAVVRVIADVSTAYLLW